MSMRLCKIPSSTSCMSSSSSLSSLSSSSSHYVSNVARMTSASSFVYLHVFMMMMMMIPTVSASFSYNDNNDNKFLQKISGKMILAPLTRGGNLPFRRLCSDFGMEVSVSEMIYSKFLLQKGNKIEKTRLRRSNNENCFGVQIATNNIGEGLETMEYISDYQKQNPHNKIDFVDLNCGCPIYEVTKRGLGSSLLRQPPKLETLISGLVHGMQDKNLNIPLTVKIRLGINDDSINVREIVDRIRTTGASAVTIHARTAKQAYRRDADWNLIHQVVLDGQEQQQYPYLPIIGNGDILTYFEAEQKMKDTHVDAVMVGRGALIKPWIFNEYKNKKELQLTIEDRIEIYYRLTTYFKDYFQDDEIGKKMTWKFLPWHFSFFCRYKSFLSEEENYKNNGLKLTTPLINQRVNLRDDNTLPLEILLNHRNEDTHELIANVLWGSDSSSNAVQRLKELAESQIFKDIQTKHSLDIEAGEIEDDTKELANISSGGGSKKFDRRKRRSEKPKRSPEEIEQIRAERAAKKKALLDEEAKK